MTTTQRDRFWAATRELLAIRLELTPGDDDPDLSPDSPDSLVDDVACLAQYVGQVIDQAARGEKTSSLVDVGVRAELLARNAAAFAAE